MRKIIFAKNHIYHVFNRGVEKRKVFLDKQDYFRFIHDLFEFNDEEPAANLYYKTSNFQSYEAKPRKIGNNEHKRKLLVEILAFCLMPNHYHLLLRQKKDGGIANFMQKLGTGYTMYFNQKYERAGSLFQGTYKAVEVENDAQLLHLPYYVHLNPVELVEPNWKDREIKNYKKVIKFLGSYRWSSYLDYTGKKNFPSVTSREFLTDIVGGPEEYKKATKEWMKELHLEEIEDVTLD